MCVRVKLSAEIEIESSPESYFKCLKEELHHLPNAASRVHGFEFHEDEFNSQGSVKSWTYTLVGKDETFKERFEIDEANCSVSMIALGGHMLERFKSYKIICKVIRVSTDKPAATVKGTLVYEKHQESDTEVFKEFEFMITMLKDLDKNLFLGK
ncbi:hypothetical protein SAY87_026587 [Trapa incisa]|uniref:Bet v I/Major latex protein domain-containing protein n=1 Tax=Trapa incisa TaxID=236973 RepID=A0AAN7JMD0_9MYRT|nr:hypothetical protein SAY87_026587 [Trapa incisa]